MPHFEAYTELSNSFNEYFMVYIIIALSKVDYVFAVN